MPSPFPGMNPYIEQPAVWQDFHDSFIPLVRELLTAQVQPRYYVKIEEHLFIHELPAHERFPLGQPDASIHPVPQLVEEERLSYLEIRERLNHEVVTIIELLSPTNKTIKANRAQYLGKVKRILASGTNFVEIDLLRGGPRIPWKALPRCDYYTIVSRGPNRKLNDPEADIWPIFLRNPLPEVPIPLRPGEIEPTLDLQAVLHRIYDAAGYALFIYASDPEPPLAPADAVWAVQLAHPEPGQLGEGS